MLIPRRFCGGRLGTVLKQKVRLLRKEEKILANENPVAIIKRLLKLVSK